MDNEQSQPLAQSPQQTSYQPPQVSQQPQTLVQPLQTAPQTAQMDLPRAGSEGNSPYGIINRLLDILPVNRQDSLPQVQQSPQPPSSVATSQPSQVSTTASQDVDPLALQIREHWGENPEIALNSELLEQQQYAQGVTELNQIVAGMIQAGQYEDARQIAEVLSNPEAAPNFVFQYLRGEFTVDPQQSQQSNNPPIPEVQRATLPGIPANNVVGTVSIDDVRTTLRQAEQFTEGKRDYQWSPQSYEANTPLVNLDNQLMNLDGNFWRTFAANGFYK